MGWDYETHPPFAIFCSGVLASPFVPDCLEHDPALKVMFPPKRLPGSMAIFAGANRLMLVGFASVRHRSQMLGVANRLIGYRAHAQSRMRVTSCRSSMRSEDAA
jgi:hypothetical protein